MSVNLQDIKATLDLTGQTQVSGADLNSLIDTAKPYDDKGLTVKTYDTGTTPDIPNPATNADWIRYLWIRQSINIVTAYVWNNNIAPGALLQWESIATAVVADGSITNAKLAALAVTGDKIANSTITSDKIAAGVIPSSLPPSGVATGDLTGSYPGPTILATAVNSAKLANNAVTTTKIADQNVTKNKLELNGGTAATAKQVLRLTVNGSAWEFVDLYSQRVRATNAAYSNIVRNAGDPLTFIPYDNSKPQVGEGTQILTLSITPQKLGSKILVKAKIPIFASGALAGLAALFLDGGADALDAAVAYCNTSHELLFLDYEYTVITNLTARVFTVRSAPANTAGTLYYNGDNASAIFNGLYCATLEAVEIQA